MRSSKALGPESGDDRIGARNDRHGYGKRADLAPHRRRRQALPDTAMAHAFLDALTRWAARDPNPSTRIAIPTGRVDGDELARLVCALGRIDRRPP